MCYPLRMSETNLMFLANRLDDIEKRINYQLRVSEGLVAQYTASESYLAELRETQRILEDVIKSEQS